MVKTRVELKLRLKDYVGRHIDTPFTTQQAVEFSQDISSNIHISPYRIQNYLRQAGAEYQRSSKTWTVP